ncbi:MAG: 30S ribosomal protein S7 [Bdellovibrionales bacterium]|nr:30S ribosomal protein S7 [Bdellovibrionales bacterium]MCB0418306.1 30S ribosomal protein S7 [Bdellovibrionales bacterium]MCB9253974.1 30S ribosomal protein S7 [Pseudobdellovibrionaceae bacterium]
MARRGSDRREEVQPDSKYNERIVTRFINSVLRQGKRSTAERIVYGAFEIIHQKTKDDPIKVFKKALSNVRPSVEVKSRRVGGSNYQVPVEVRPERRNSLAFRWILDYAKARRGNSMTEKVAQELFDAAENRGEAVKKREDTHRMAESNKAFAHYRW